MDLTPPASPRGLVAVPAAGAIGLIWDTNREADLLGFVVYRREPLSEEHAQAVRRLSQLAVVKEVLSPDRLLDQLTLFLHRRFDELPPAQRQTVHNLHGDGKNLVGRKVLIVDDDIRNIFALTSILEQHQMRTVAAVTGRDAIGILECTPDVEAVLMDVMMPEMDGLDTTRVLRENDRFRDLPIIAVTAKAMRGDREKCIEAGAWDYLSKPVDPEELLAMLQAWLIR
jgi:CheY-like chemotaxis protein